MKGSDAVVAIDVGGTTIKSAIAGPGGVERLPAVATPREDGPDAVVAAVITTAIDAVARCRAAERSVIGLAAAALGLVDETAGQAIASAAAGWLDVPLASLLADATGVPAVLGHDVRAAAAIEAAYGAAADRSPALFVPIGTGIAAALVIDGAVVSGASHCAGEIGQLPAPDGPATIEAVASARAIAARYAAETGATGATAKDVGALVGDGDPAATAVWNDALGVLAGVLAAAVTTVDPAVIVVGGGLAEAGDVLLDPLSARLTDALVWRPAPPLVRAAYGADAALAGAAVLAWERAASRDRAELAPVLAPARWSALR